MSTFRDSRALPVPDGWAHHLEAWRVALVAAGRSPRTIRTRVDEVTGGDLAVVQDLLGHASPVTTRIYVPRNLGRMRAAVVAASA